MNVLHNFLNWGAGVLKVVEDTAYPDLNNRLNRFEEEQEVFEPSETEYNTHWQPCGGLFDTTKMEIVAPPATLDDIYTVLCDIHDLLAASSTTPDVVDGLSTTGRVDGRPAGVEGQPPIQPPPAGSNPSFSLLEFHYPSSEGRDGVEGVRCRCCQWFNNEAAWANHLAKIYTHSPTS